jgi:iron complex transport system permease protein
MTSARVSLAVAAACAALAGLVIVAFAVGRYPVSVGDQLGVLWSGLTGTDHGLDPTIETVVLKVRGPRVAGAILIGAALAAAGAAYQNMFRNPLVSPDILGVSAGAAVGAVLGIFLSLNVIVIQSLAFAFGLGAVGLDYVTPTTSCRRSPSGCWAAWHRPRRPTSGPRCRSCCSAWSRCGCCAGASTCCPSTTRKRARSAWKPGAYA